MSAYEEEVELFSEFSEDQTELKSAIWKDEDMKEYIREVGLEETLYDVTVFHRNLADNCRLNQITSLTDERDWARKALSLNIRAKSRRQQLRAIVRERYGPEAVQAITDRVFEEFGE